MKKMKTKGMKVLDNKLYIGKYSIEELVKEYESPLYIYDEENIRYKLDLFKKYFNDSELNCKTVYATKAFFAPAMLDIIKEYGMGIDSVSLGDLMMIDKTSFLFKDVVLHGNNKTEEELIFSLKKGVGIIVVDNISELKLLVKLTNDLKKEVHILLRVNPGISAHTHEYIQTSKLDSKFGESIFDLKIQDEFIKICKESKYIIFDGYHAHIGSSINEPNSFKEEAKVMLEFMADTEKRNDVKFNTLNLGGGFGIKYLDDDKEIDLKEMLETIVSTTKEYNDKYDIGIKNLVVEPGRSIVGDSGITAYTVGGKKKTYGGKEYVFVDGGMTDNIRPALYQALYTVDNASNMNGEKILCDVVGPCCESGDIVSSNTYVQSVKPGDKVVAYSTGAYGYSMCSNYNGSLKHTVLFIKGDEIKVAIKKETYGDLSKQFPYENKYKVFDCHSDMLYDLWTSKTRGIVNRFENYHVNQLQNSVVGGALWTMYSEFDFNLIEACKIALKEIKMEQLPGFKVVLGLEGLRNLHEISELDTLYEMGFRHAMVTWNEENKWATGAKSNPERGFTDEGRKLLKHMEELGMIIDLAHTNEKSFWDALEVVNKNIIYSHGLCKCYCDHPRNLTDEQLKALKDVDGLFGLTLADSFISKNEDERTFEMFMKHVKHAIDIMGVDNVCFGFDFMDYLSEFPNSNLVDVPDATFTYRIVEGLKDLGLSDEEVNKICFDNFFKRYGHLVHEFK